MPALVDLGACIIIQGPKLDYLFVANLPEVWAKDHDIAPTDENLFGDDVAGRLAAVKTEMADPGRKGHVEIMVGAEKFFEFRIQSVEFEIGRAAWRESGCKDVLI